MPRSFALEDKQYKRRDKKEAHEEYKRVSRDLSNALKAGKITQEDFDDKHEALDYRFRWLNN